MNFGDLLGINIVATLELWLGRFDRLIDAVERIADSLEKG